MEKKVNTVAVDGSFVHLFVGAALDAETTTDWLIQVYNRAYPLDCAVSADQSLADYSEWLKSSEFELISGAVSLFRHKMQAALHEAVSEVGSKTGVR